MENVEFEACHLLFESWKKLIKFDLSDETERISCFSSRRSEQTKSD